MYRVLKEAVYEANMALYQEDLVIYTWGNVSQVDRQAGVFAIKPSGVPYRQLKAEDIVVLDLEGKQVEGALRPSSDTPTHLVLYNDFADIGGIVHTHSTYATMWAQAGRDIPCYGTTHADYFYGPVPCARALTEAEIRGAYEYNTGKVIYETFQQRGLNPVYIPAVLVKSHAPFAWGEDGAEAVHNAKVLEQVAMMASGTLALCPSAPPVDQAMLDKHFLRKHGENAYYGQK